MPLFSKNEPSKKVVVFCPVCNTSLGKRTTGEFFIANCSDCCAQYSWKPFQHKPKAILLKDLERKKCGCMSCEAKGH